MTKHYRPDPDNPPQLIKSDLARLDRMTDEDIDYSDIAELDDGFFVTAKHPARFLTLADLSADPWNVMRRLLPPDADVSLLLAARSAAFDAMGRIMDAEQRGGWNAPTAFLLSDARMALIGRVAMLDDWRSHLLGTAFISRRPYGEDTRYARAMRLRPEKLAEVIAITELDESEP